MNVSQSSARSVISVTPRPAVKAPARTTAAFPAIGTAASRIATTPAVSTATLRPNSAPTVPARAAATSAAASQTASRGVISTPAVRTPALHVIPVPAAPASVSAPAATARQTVSGTVATPATAGSGAVQADPTPDDRPTAESVFGANPWLSDPEGYSATGGSYSYNPVYFATRATAEKVAQLLGGTVVEQNAMVGDNGPFHQTAANEMVRLPNGHLVNAGLTASYYTHGWSQSQIDHMLELDREV